MSSAIFIPWENKLAKVMREPGGVRVADALEKAARNLDLAKDDCLADMDEQLAELESLAGQAGRQPADDVKNRIYDLSNDVVAIAGAFQLTELGQAAFCLCELVDRLRAMGLWSQPAVEVHLSACRLLRRPDASTDRSKVLAGLKQLIERISVIAE
jgi:hypothetical protein